MQTSRGLRLVFAGTPVFAAAHLQALISSAHSVVGVYTQPDRPSGRGKVLTASPVKQLALEHNIPVFQPISLKPREEQQALQALNADVLVVVAYGLLLPAPILDTPAMGCLNVHASLLPRWRGAAPIQRAIEAGDTQTGITIMQMDVGLDTGDMLHKVSCDIRADDTAGSLHDRLAELGPPALLHVLEQLANGKVNREVQDDTLSTYAKKINKQDAVIDWAQDAETICLKIRAFNPVPVCTTHLDNTQLRLFFAEVVGTDELAKLAATNAAPGKVLAISGEGLVVACGKGVLKILSLQLPGKKLMSIKQFCNGYINLIPIGTRFS